MDENLIANLLSITYPYLIIIFWVLVIAAIVWGVVKLVKKLQHKTEK